MKLASIAHFFRLGISHVDSINKLSYYLAYKAKKVSNSYITHYFRQTKSYWKLTLTSNQSVKEEKTRMLAKAHVATLIEFWLYSLGKVTPLIQSNNSKNKLYAEVATLLEKQLLEQPNIEKYIDLEQATNNFSNLLQITDFTKSHGLDPSPALIKHLEELIGKQEQENSSSIVSGHLRSLIMQFEQDWKETVITESIIRQITEQNEQELEEVQKQIKSDLHTQKNTTKRKKIKAQSDSKK